MKKQQANTPRAINAAPPTVPPTMAPTLVESCSACPDEIGEDVEPNITFVSGEVIGEDVGE